jgi:hypothetical protein
MAARLQPARYVPRPTFDELVALKNDYMDYHQRRIGNHRQDEQFFRMRYDVPSPDGRTPLYSPSAYQIVEELINHVAAETPTFNILKRNPDEDEIKRAEKLTAWINGFWKMADITKIMRLMFWFDCVRGCHVFRILYDPGAWPLEPEPPIKPVPPPDIELAAEKVVEDYAIDLAEWNELRSKYKDDHEDWKSYTEEHCPITTQVIDPIYAFWEPSDDPSRIFLVWDRTVDDIIKDHPQMWDDLGGIKPGTKLQWVEYYDEFDYCYWVESYGSRISFRNNPQNVGGYFFNSRPNSIMQVQGLKRHGYGYFPFIIDGPWITPLQDPADQYPSIYYAIKSMIQYESTLLTQMAHMIRINGWAPLVVKTDRSDAQKPNIDMTPGVTNYIETEEDVRYLEFSGTTMNVLNELIGAVSQYTEKGTGLGNLLQGAPKGKSGYQQAQLAAMARVALVPMEHSTERTFKKASRFILKLIRSMQQAITVLGVYGDNNSEATVTPKDVSKVGLIDMRLKTVMPIDEGSKIANYSNMVKMGWISRTTAARLVGIENPEEEHARWIAEEISQLPDVMKAQAMQYVAEHWPDLFQIMMQLEQQAQQQANTQVGPGGPGGAGGGSQPGRPGQKRPNAPGSAGEQDQIIRQSQTGSAPQKRLQGPSDE